MNISFSNRSDAGYEKLFNALILDTFGFTFSPWLEMKLWDSRYESFSFIESGKMLSNISLFKTGLVIGGKRIDAYQLGAVATRGEARGMGLAGKLMRHIFTLYPDAPMFLFANGSVLDFYPRFGFIRVYEYSPKAEFTVHNPEAALNRLEPHDPIVKKYLSNGRMLSRTLCSTETETVEMFHLLITYSDDIYHIPALDTLVVAAARSEELFIAYMNKPDEVPFEAVARLLPFSGIQTIRFGFMPDIPRPECTWERMESGDESMFIKGNIPLPDTFAFPALAKT